MSENTKIEWADHTFNPWIGCTKVGPGCDNCYAKADFDDRKHRVTWGNGQARSRTKTWGDPVRWNKQHEVFFAEHGRRQRVFCASLADVFDNEVAEKWRADLLDLIRSTPNLDWLLLTKRIGNAKEMLDRATWLTCRDRTDPTEWQAPNNVWIGATIVNQEEAYRDIPKLLAVPAAKRFLSMEPLLGPVDLHLSLTTVEERLRVQRELAKMPGEFRRLNSRGELLHWVIVGGESGHGARPMHPDWARNLRDQCEAAGVPFLFKQWGEWAPDDGFVSIRDEMHEWGEGLEINSRSWRRGKKAAGRLLDGREWNGVPT